MLFASPWYLLGALGALFPVLIHLYGRRRARRVLFPSLMLIQAAQRERTSLVRLRQVWLMLLRALAILCLALALARPSLPWLRLAGDPEALAVVVVDDSLSMRTRGTGQARFEVARTAALSLLNALPEHQEVRLVFASQAAPLHAHSRTELRDLLRTRQASCAAVDVGALFGRITAIPVANEAPRQHFYVFTDLQSSGFSGASHLLAGDTVTLVDCGQEIANRAVGRPELSEPPALSGRPATVMVPALAYGRRGPMQVRLRVGRGELPPQRLQGGQQALFEWLPESAGAVTLTAQTEPDALREDDRSYAAVKVRETLRLLLVGTPDQTRWVRLALQPQEGLGVTVRSALPEALETYEALMLWRLEEPERVRRYCEQGGGVVLFAGGLSQRALDQLTGPQAPALGVPRRLNSPERIVAFDAYRAPLRAFSNPAAGDLQEPSFRELRPLAVSGDSAWRVLAQFGEGTPALLAGQVGSGRALLANFPTEPAGSDLAEKPVFVPLMHRLAGYVGKESWPELAEAIAGRAMLLAPPDGGSEPRLESPGQAVEAVTVQPSGWTFTPAVPGVYRLFWSERGAAKSAAFAANVEPAESDLTRLTEVQVRRLLAPAQVELRRPEAASVLPRGPLSLTVPLLILAFLLLVAEVLFSQAGQTRSEGETART